MSRFAQARERNDTLRNAGGIAPLLGLFVVSNGSFASVGFPFFRAFLVSLHWSFPSFLLSRLNLIVPSSVLSLVPLAFFPPWFSSRFFLQLHS